LKSKTLESLALFFVINQSRGNDPNANLGKLIPIYKSEVREIEKDKNFKFSRVLSNTDLLS
jgi:hypothetical protein